MDGITQSHLCPKACQACKKRFVPPVSRRDPSWMPDEAMATMGLTRGTLLACGRCKGACYCSKECQRSDWKVHKVTCFPVAIGDKDSLRKLIKKELQGLSKGDDAYDDIAQQEMKLFQAIYGKNFEAKTFPTVFFHGSTRFDDEHRFKPLRFKDYLAGLVQSLHFKLQSVFSL